MVSGSPVTTEIPPPAMSLRASLFDFASPQATSASATVTGFPSGCRSMPPPLAADGFLVHQ